MYFIKYRILKKNLQNRSVTVRESLPYLIAFVILETIPDIFPVGGHNLWDSISSVLSIVAFVAGVCYAYYKNGGAAGSDFFLKYILIGWVVSIRFLLVFILVIPILVYLGYKTGLMSLDEWGPYETTVFFLAEVIFYQRIGRHIKDTVSN